MVIIITTSKHYLAVLHQKYLVLSNTIFYIPFLTQVCCLPHLFCRIEILFISLLGYAEKRNSIENIQFIIFEIF